MHIHVVHTKSFVAVQLSLTRVVTHSGNGGEGLALRSDTVLLKVETLQQQGEILFRVLKCVCVGGGVQEDLLQVIKCFRPIRKIMHTPVQMKTAHTAGFT